MTDKRYRGSTDKTSTTDMAARSITPAENMATDEKTARLKKARLAQEAKLDEALDESFPASDPVEVGHSEHAGRPKAKR